MSLLALFLAGVATFTCNPVPTSDGYRVSIGTQSGTYTDVRSFSAPPFTVTGLPSCTQMYFAAKAFRDNGDESEEFSNEVSGWADVEINSVSNSPPYLVQGDNFGDDVIATCDGESIAVEVLDCTTLQVGRPCLVLHLRYATGHGSPSGKTFFYQLPTIGGFDRIDTP